MGKPFCCRCFVADDGRCIPGVCHDSCRKIFVYERRKDGARARGEGGTLKGRKVREYEYIFEAN